MGSPGDEVRVSGQGQGQWSGSGSGLGLRLGLGLELGLGLGLGPEAGDGLAEWSEVALELHEDSVRLGDHSTCSRR